MKYVESATVELKEKVTDDVKKEIIAFLIPKVELFISVLKITEK